jgi:hypothetical protein
VYAYWLGSKDHFPADRKTAQEVAACRPQVVASALANRAFLGRVARYLAGRRGVRQFLDIGPGLPAPGATHAVAQAIAPQSRVVYVDNDPVVLAHARALLTSTCEGGCDYLDGDLRDPEAILKAAAQTWTSPSPRPSSWSLSSISWPTRTTRPASWPRWPPRWRRAASWRYRT